MMVWTPEPWLGFTIMLGVGLTFVVLGLIPLLPSYKVARAHDPTHWISYVGRVVVGLMVSVWAFIRYFGYL